jgi:hypothetical protein
MSGIASLLVVDDDDDDDDDDVDDDDDDGSSIGAITIAVDDAGKGADAVIALMNPFSTSMSSDEVNLLVSKVSKKK